MNTIKNTPLALVTGASRGIGRAIAETLAGAGYDLVLTCSRTLPELSGLANSLEEKYGIHCTAQMADASDPSAIEKIFSSLDHLDVLVNNAGISYIGLLTDMSIEEWQNDHKYESQFLFLHLPSGNSSDASKAQRTYHQYFLRLGKRRSFHGSRLFRFQGRREQLHQSSRQGAGAQQYPGQRHLLRCY